MFSLYNQTIFNRLERKYNETAGASTLVNPTNLSLVRVFNLLMNSSKIKKPKIRVNSIVSVQALAKEFETKLPFYAFKIAKEEINSIIILSSHKIRLVLNLPYFIGINIKIENF